MSGRRAHTLRIVAGELRGRRLKIPVDAPFRPTTDRVREALFNILGQWLHDATVVDLYAGSGALGLEALSRGARHVTFVEREPAVAGRIEECLVEWGLTDRSRVVRSKVIPWLRSAQGPLDFVLADPPYSTGEARSVLKELGKGPGLLAATGILTLENRAQDKPDARVLGEFQAFRSGTYGSSRLDCFQYRSESADG